MSPVKYLLDSNAVDDIFARGAVTVLAQALRDGKIKILYTGTLLVEMAKIPDLDKRIERLLTLVTVGQCVPSAAGVLTAPPDETTPERHRHKGAIMGHFRFATESAIAVYEAVKGGSHHLIQMNDASEQPLITRAPC